MKKIALFSMFLCISISLIADDIVMSAQAKLSITSANNSKGANVILYESASSFTNNKEDDYEGPFMASDVAQNSKVINFWVSSCPWSADGASRFAVPDLIGTKMTFQSNRKDSEYTMTFSNIIGTIHLKDLVTETIITIKDGVAPYVFTQAADNSIVERFEIVEIPAEPAICHQYGNLIITGHQGAKVKVLDMADQVAIAEQTLASDDEVISLSTLTKGEMYQVVVDDGEPMLIRIQ